MDKNILSVKNLCLDFNGHCILDNLSFDIKRDSVVSVVGSNGSGKTVLFKSLLNLIEFGGQVEWSKDARIGYVPQKLSVSKDLPITVLEFLKLKSSNDVEINEKLQEVGFQESAKHIHHSMKVVNTKLGNLSGGELQRILIANALLGDPNVLLLDEPTAGVDIEGQDSFYALFEKLKKDKDLTIMFISHDREIVEKYSDQIIKLNHAH